MRICPRHSYLAAVGLIVGGTVLLSVGFSQAEPKGGQVLRHIVLYKFKDSVKPAEVQEVVDAFVGLRGKIDSIVALESGTNVSPEGKSEGLTHCFVVTFRDEAARDAYLKHPAHQDYVKIVRDRREKVVVFDFWAPAPAPGK
jgi:hypothetical protein